MKKILFVFCGMSIISCGGLNRTVMGASEPAVIKTVAIEKGCPKEQVKIVERIKRMGNATYRVEACGKQYVYKQVGSVIMEAEQANNILK
ncbi:hypothetical protein ACF3NR_02205 [Vaginella massiliensis]|uniref:hypothetical protein n=1 Tax=Vaginella massiliensis TaxID=1816680 RepID=UPI0037529362